MSRLWFKCSVCRRNASVLALTLISVVLLSMVHNECRNRKSNSDIVIVPPINEGYLNEPVNYKSPKVVYYLWCGLNPNFGFQNYLSMISAINFLSPERIYFLYTKYPETDLHMYHSWLDELKDKYQNIVMKNVSSQFDCEDSHQVKDTILDYLQDGGIFIGTSTILTKPSMYLWNEEFINIMSEARAGIAVATPVKKIGNIRLRRKIREFNRKPCSNFNMQSPTTNVSDICIILPLDIKPKHIWNMTSDLGKLLNGLMYGQPMKPISHPSKNTGIPNIGHMLWLNGKSIDFLFYLSALSFIYVAKVGTLYIHGDTEPVNDKYWKMLMKEEKIRFIKLIKPTHIYGDRSIHPHHMSDIFRAELMMKYGGIYADVDVIWTKAISDELRKYDAVASFDWAHNYPHYPDYINLGVSMGRAGAPFWRYFLESFKTFRDDIFGFNGLLQPYKIYERHPDTLYIEPHLQVMCFRSECYPRFRSDWKSIIWEEDVYAFHWTYPNPPEFMNMNTLAGNNTMFAKIGRHVLKKAGKL